MKTRIEQFGPLRAAWMVAVVLAVMSVACSDGGSSNGADSQGSDSSGTNGAGADTAGGQGGGGQGSTDFDFSNVDCPAGTTNQWSVFAGHPACIELLEHNRDCQCVNAEDPATCAEDYNDQVGQTVSSMFCYPSQTPVFAIPAACDAALAKVEECN